MTDSTQEIDEILALLDARMPQPKTMNEYTARVAMLRGAKRALLDWHNKQVEAVLDRLENRMLYLGSLDVHQHIEAERNKLKETEL